MKTIYKPQKSVLKVLEKQEFRRNTQYRHLYFLINTDNGILFNNLTKAVYKLNDSEFQAFNKLNFDNKAVQQLFHEWCIVPNDFNESQTFEEIRETFKLYQTESNIVNYSILTTTNCNARCYYCYERNYKRMDMTDETANSIAEYIIKNTNKANIMWFGGEPLLGIRHIDQICQKLKEADIKLKSKISTNGYLFDEDTIKKARDLWNLKAAQITIDGTEDVYNKIKNYIYHDKSPYKRILSNIDLLLENDIAVTIRLNVSKNNYEDLNHLIKELKNHELLCVYVQAISQEKESDVHQAYEMELEIDKLISNAGFNNGNMIKTSIPISTCIANDDRSVCILPNGDLTSCEHVEILPPWGNINSEHIDLSLYNEWRKRVPKNEHCDKCKFYPVCCKLLHCSDVLKDCPKAHRDYIHKKTIRALSKLS